jgi:hypothetical protein
VRPSGVDEGVGGWFVSYSYTDSKNLFISVKQKMTFWSKIR